MMMRVVVTGVSGQVGGALMACTIPGVTLIPADRSVLDLNRPETLAAALDALAPDVVVNCAAYTAVDAAETDAAAAYRINAEAPGVLAAWCAGHGAAIIQISTDYVFDGSLPGARMPADPVQPPGVYGASKEAGERAVRDACARHIILRTAWIYAATGKNFLLTMLRLAETRDHLRVVADQVGCPTPASEVARAVARALARLADGQNGPWGTYHFCCAGETSWHGFAEAIFARAAIHTGRRPTVEAITTADYPTPARRPANSVLDCTDFARDYGCVPVDWQTALTAVMDGLSWDKGDCA